MNMLSTILNLIGIIVMAVGAVCIYDARKLAKKFFGSGDTNAATRTFKIVGLIVFLIGTAIVFIWGN